MSKLLLPCLLLLLHTALAQSVGIGTATPDANAALHIESTTQGTLITRLSTVQRDAIASPPEGLMIYNTTTHCLEVYNGSLWISYCGGFVTPPFTFSLAANPTCLGMHPSGADSTTITVTVLSGVSVPVSLSVSAGLPTNCTATFTPTSISPTGTSKLKLQGTGVTPGEYTLTVSATDGTTTLTQDITLVVSSYTISFPQGLSGLQGWWRADSLSTLTIGGGNATSAWNDISGNTKHFAQGTGGLQPTYTASLASLGGRPALYFDGSNDLLTAPNVLNNATNATTFIVMQPSTATLRFVLEQRPNESQYSLENCSGATLSHYINNSGGAGATLNAGTGYYLSYVAGTQMRAWRNGSMTGGPSAYGGNTGTGALTIGGRSSGACASYYQGYIAEIILYNRALSDCERQQVERYLKAKYSL